MSFLGDLFGSKPSPVSIATTSNAPPSYIEGPLKDAINTAVDIGGKPLQYYPNQTYVDFSPTTMGAIEMGEARAEGGSPLVSSAQDFTNTAIGGGFTNPAANMLMSTAQGDFLSGNNPYLSAAMQPAIDQVQGQFSQFGRLGSGANMSAMTSALAPVYAQNYATERQNQLAAQNAIGDLAQQDFANRIGAAAMAPTLAAQDYTDIGQLLNFGAMREAKTGEALASDIDKFNFEQQEPQTRLANLLAALRGGTMGSTSSQPIYADPTSAAIGNIATLAGGAKLASDAGIFKFLGGLFP